MGDTFQNLKEKTVLITGNTGFKGSWLAIKRLSKCRPGHPGGIDEV